MRDGPGPRAGLFLLLGATPHSDWLPPEVAVDDRGFVLTGRNVPRESWLGEVPPPELTTSVPGIFAVGDVRADSMKRVAAAAGEGSSVVPLVHALARVGRVRLTRRSVGQPAGTSRGFLPSASPIGRDRSSVE